MKYVLIAILILFSTFLVSPAYAGELNDPSAGQTFQRGVIDKTFGTGGEGSSLESNPFNQGLVGDTREALPAEISAIDKANPLYLINQIVRVLLSFLGIGTIILMLYAGFKWMTSGGNSEQVDQAKKTLRNAVIGLILILMAYSLTVWVARRIQRATSSFGPNNTTDFTVEGIQRFNASSPADPTPN